MIERSIWLAIKSRIETLPMDWDLAWPAEIFEPPYSSGGLLPYIRVGHVTASPTSLLIAYDKPHLRSGSVIITTVVPMGRDLGAHQQTAGAIAAHFRDGTQMRYRYVCVTVPTYPHVQPGYETDGYWNVPVNVPWRCFA